MLYVIKLLPFRSFITIWLVFVASSAIADISDEDWNGFIEKIVALEDRFGDPTERDGDLIEAAKIASNEARQLVAHRAGSVYHMAEVLDPDGPKCVAIARRLALKLDLNQTVEAVLFDIRSTIANMSARMGDIEREMGLPKIFSAFAYFSEYRDLAAEMQSARELSEEALIPIWNETCVGRFRIGSDHAINTSETFFELTQGRLHPSADAVPVLRILGSIESGYSKRFLAIVKQYPEVRYVEIAGPGGNVFEAMHAGRIIRDQGLGVMVRGQCRSMCPFILMGDRSRTLPHNHGPIGFHPLSFSHEGSRRFPIRNPDNPAYEPLMRYIYEMGGSGHRLVMYMLMNSTASVDFYYPSTNELCAAGFVERIHASREFQSRGCWHEELALSKLERDCKYLSALRSSSVNGSPAILRDLDERGAVSEFYSLVAATDKKIISIGCLSFAGLR